MRVRAVDANGDMMFGGDQASILRDSPDAVAQVVESRINLWEGQWHLDLSDGTPIEQEVLGRYTANIRDAALQGRILGSPGVDAIKTYTGALDKTTRTYSVSAELKTAYSIGGSASASPNSAFLDTKVEFGR